MISKQTLTEAAAHEVLVRDNAQLVSAERTQVARHEEIRRRGLQIRAAQAELERELAAMFPAGSEVWVFWREAQYAPTRAHVRRVSIGALGAGEVRVKLATDRGLMLSVAALHCFNDEYSARRFGAERARTGIDPMAEFLQAAYEAAQAIKEDERK